MIVASGEIGVKVTMELCQRVLDGRGKPDEWKIGVIVPIFKRKGDVISCGSYRAVRLLEHAMKIIERVLKDEYKHQSIQMKCSLDLCHEKEQWMRYSL